MAAVVWVAIIGVGAATVTAMGAILVAIINTRNEKAKSTAAAVEKAEERADERIETALRERILLRDEQLLDCKEEVAELEAEVASLKAENERLRKSS